MLGIAVSVANEGWEPGGEEEQEADLSARTLTRGS